MTEIEKMKRYISRTKLDKGDRFCMNVGEAFELAARAHENNDLPLDIISLAFDYGKAKGYRAAQAKMKEAI